MYAGERLQWSRGDVAPGGLCLLSRGSGGQQCGPGNRFHTTHPVGPNLVWRLPELESRSHDWSSPRPLGYLWGEGRKERRLHGSRDEGSYSGPVGSRVADGRRARPTPTMVLSSTRGAGDGAAVQKHQMLGFIMLFILQLGIFTYLSICFKVVSKEHGRLKGSTLGKVDGNASWCSHSGKQDGGSSKN